MGREIDIDGVATNKVQFRVGGKAHGGGAGRFHVQLAIMMRATLQGGNDGDVQLFEQIFQDLSHMRKVFVARQLQGTQGWTHLKQIHDFVVKILRDLRTALP